MLYLVATPIGNLKDITLRALETLKEVDYILCEDMRVTRKLLTHYQIQKPLKNLTDFNETKALPATLADLKKGAKIALVSDAGSPLISDPGFKLVRECIKESLPVEVIPGSSAVIAALQLSGLPPDKFSFWGYLPKKPGQRLKFLQSLKKIAAEIPQTFIFFESPHRLIKTLADFADVFGENQLIVICRELTKFYQEVKRESIKDSLTHFAKQKPKGEFTLLLNVYLLEYCGALRARLRPYFLRSFMRGSRVKTPFFFKIGRFLSKSSLTIALDNPKTTASS